MAQKLWGADAAELVHDSETAEDGVVVDNHMATQGGGIGHDHVVPQLTVVGDMSVGHQQVVVADAGGRCILQRAAVDGGEFADHVAITNLQPGLFAGVLFILGIFTDRGELEDAVVLADAGQAL